MDWKESLQSLLPDDYQPQPDSALEPKAAPKPMLTITLDRKRAGKTATIICGFEPGDERAEQLAKLLKQKLAVGGSVRDGEILLQGDFTKKLPALLLKEGYKSKTHI